MDEKKAKYIINEFTSKANELKRSKFVQLILDDIELRKKGKEGLFRFGIHIKEDKEGKEEVHIETHDGKFKRTFKAKIEPDIRYIDIEFFRSAIPLIRMFIQHDEIISIANLAKAYHFFTIRKYFHENIVNTRKFLKENLVDAKWEIDGINRSHWEILQTFLYSNVLHSDMEKKEIWNSWLKNPDSHSKVIQSLHLSTGIIAIKVIGLAILNETLLKEMERSKDYKNVLYIVEENKNLEIKTVGELKELACYAYYDLPSKIFNHKINDIITINEETFQIVWKHLNSRNSKLIGIYRCIRLHFKQR